jgi:hypothetical protein
MSDAPKKLFKGLDKAQQKTSATTTPIKKKLPAASSASPGKVETPRADNAVAKDRMVCCQLALDKRSIPQ